MSSLVDILTQLNVTTAAVIGCFGVVGYAVHKIIAYFTKKAAPYDVIHKSLATIYHQTLMDVQAMRQEVDTCRQKISKMQDELEDSKALVSYIKRTLTCWHTQYPPSKDQIKAVRRKLG